MAVLRLLSARYLQGIWVSQEVVLAQSVCLRLSHYEASLSLTFLDNLMDVCDQNGSELSGVLKCVLGQKPEYKMSTSLALGNNL